MKDKQQQGAQGATQEDGHKGRRHKAQDDGKKTLDTNSPRTRDQVEQVKVWEEEGGSPPQEISSTRSTRPKTDARTGAMGPTRK